MKSTRLFFLEQSIECGVGLAALVAGPPALEPDRPVQQQAAAEQVVGDHSCLERGSKQACNQQQGPQERKRVVYPFAAMRNSGDGRGRVLKRTFWHSQFHIRLSVCQITTSDVISLARQGVRSLHLLTIYHLLTLLLSGSV